MRSQWKFLSASATLQLEKRILNRLQLNPGTTGVLWCSTGQLPIAALLIYSVPVALVPSVHNLGIFIGTNLVMCTHVQCWVSRCFAALHLLCKIRRLLPTATFQSLVVVALSARLWQQRAGGHSFLFSILTSICAQFSCMARLQFGTLWSHHRWAHQPSLAVHPGANRV